MAEGAPKSIADPAPTPELAVALQAFARETTVIGSAVVEGDRIVAIDEPALALLGRTRAELGTSDPAVLALLAPSPDAREQRVVGPDGRERVVLVKTVPLGAPPGRRACFLVDVTSRRVAELRREETLLGAGVLAGASHELRSPLHTILGFAELLHRGQAGPLAPRQLEHVGDILASGRRLARVLDDVLALAKAATGPASPRPVDVAALLAEVRGLLKDEAITRRVRVETEVPADLPCFVLDPARLRRVLHAHLAHALARTPPGGGLRVRVLREDEGLRIELAGPGSGAVAEGPTAIGLALARRIVEAAGGAAGDTRDQAWVRLPARPV